MLVLQRVVDLVVERHGLLAFVDELESGTLRERHGQPDVHAGFLAHGMDSRSVGLDDAVGDAEEVGHGALDARVLLVVPPDANHQASQVIGDRPRGHPDVPDRARPFDVAKCHLLARLDAFGPASLSGGTKVAGRLAALTRRPGRVLEGDRSGQKPRIKEVGLCHEVDRRLGRQGGASQPEKRGNRYQ
jgi:hypothetical protein